MPYRIPLSLRGTTSFVDVRLPTKLEAADLDLMRLELTYQTPEWEPGSSSYADLEEKLLDDPAVRLSTGDQSSKYSSVEYPKTNIRTLSVANQNAASCYEHEASQSASVIASISPVLCDDLLSRTMYERCRISAFHTTEGSRSMSAENWGIPLERAKRTLAVTTQRGLRIRPSMLSMLTQRFKTNDRTLRYRRLNTVMFTDTLEAGTLSRRKNKYAQVFAVPPNWTKVYSIKRKSDAHHCLNSLFVSCRISVVSMGKVV
jgi:hypothetical protein